MALLTDQSLASGVTLNDLIHIVIPTDTSQNPAGSSFKATIKQVADSITGSTVNLLGKYLPLSGGTVTGNTYFGITSGITLDQVNSRIGIGTSTPQNTLELYGSNSVVNYGLSTGGYFELSGNTGLPRFQATSGPSGSNPSYSIQMGVRNYNDVTFPGYGATGDTYVYASNDANGLNIINRQGTGLQDYIRFYAGQDANGTIPDIHIQGSGSTRGNVGIATITPTEKLDVSGNTLIRSGMTASTITISSTPATDTSLSANYLTRDGSTGRIKLKQIPGPTVYGLFSQTGNSAVVSATTVESTLIGGGVGSLSIPANGFNIADSFVAKLSGHISCVGTATIHIRVKAGSILLCDTGVIQLDTTTNKHWQIELNFTIRQLGVAGVASIVSSGLYSYVKNSGINFEGSIFISENNTTFDTTILNTLDITAEWNTNNSGNSIYSQIFVLNKIF